MADGTMGSAGNPGYEEALRRSMATPKPLDVAGSMQDRLAILRAGVYGTLRYRQRLQGGVPAQTLLGGSPEPKKPLLGI